MFKLTDKELVTLKALDTPNKVQDFLDDLPRNFEKKGDTLFSPRRVLREKKAHCIEGALLAGVAFWLQGRPALILDLKSSKDDDSHVVTLFKENGYWGAVSKTNHASLRWRDPIFKNIREIALSYFHEYFIDDGKKTLVSYARYNVKRLGTAWITDEEDLLWLNRALDSIPHIPLVPEKNKKFIRHATVLERQAGRLLDWKKSDPGT